MIPDASAFPTAIFTSVTAPLLLAALVAWITFHGKREDYRRQDAVAAKAQDVADSAQSSSTIIVGKLDTIHELVNSNLTRTIEAELAAMEHVLALQAEIDGLRKQADLPGAGETEHLMAITTARIDGLRAILKERAVVATRLDDERQRAPRLDTTPGSA